MRQSFKWGRGRGTSEGLDLPGHRLGRPGGRIQGSSSTSQPGETRPSPSRLRPHLPTTLTVIERLRELGAEHVSELAGEPENMVFALPKELRLQLVD